MEPALFFICLQVRIMFLYERPEILSPSPLVFCFDFNLPLPHLGIVTSGPRHRRCPVSPAGKEVLTIGPECAFIVHNLNTLEIYQHHPEKLKDIHQVTVCGLVVSAVVSDAVYPSILNEY